MIVGMVLKKLCSQTILVTDNGLESIACILKIV